MTFRAKSYRIAAIAVGRGSAIMKSLLVFLVGSCRAGAWQKKILVSLLLSSVGCAGKLEKRRFGEAPEGPVEVALSPEKVSAFIDEQNDVDFEQLKSLVAQNESRSNLLVVAKSAALAGCGGEHRQSQSNLSNGERSREDVRSFCVRPARFTRQVSGLFRLGNEKRANAEFLQILQPLTPTYADPQRGYLVSAIRTQIESTFVVIIKPQPSKSLETLTSTLTWKELSSVLSRMQRVDLARITVPSFTLSSEEDWSEELKSSSLGSVGHGKKMGSHPHRSNTLRVRQSIRFEFLPHRKLERAASGTAQSRYDPNETIPVEGFPPKVTPLFVDQPFLALVVDSSTGELLVAAAVYRPEPSKGLSSYNYSG